MKIAYIGIDLFYDALVSLADSGCEIAEIFSCPTDNETEFNLKITGYAKSHNIPLSLCRITAEDIERLKKKGCSFAVCGGYYYKIPVDGSFPIVNIHPSLLPVGRGSWPMPQAILRGFKESGVTVHKIAEGFDTGDILLQKSFEISENETHESFMDKACSLLPEMMKYLCENFGGLWENARPQGEGDYWAAPTESDWTVKETDSIKKADLILRAFFGYECIYEGNGKKYRILKGRLIKGAPPAGEKNVLYVQGGYIKAEKAEEI